MVDYDMLYDVTTFSLLLFDTQGLYNRANNAIMTSTIQLYCTFPVCPIHMAVISTASRSRDVSVH